jgi:hypothetical protein
VGKLFDSGQAWGCLGAAWHPTGIGAAVRPARRNFWPFFRLSRRVSTVLSLCDLRIAITCRLWQLAFLGAIGAKPVEMVSKLAFASLPRILNPGEMAAETRSSQAPTADRSPLLFGGTCRASWLYIRHIPPFTKCC